MGQIANGELDKTKKFQIVFLINKQAIFKFNKQNLSD